ncbi:MAG: glycosyltransferase [Candidatus Saccharibacteria bacterium]|nr:glycosyltransferase [Candidatus Saccharibacteria bacterium]
MKKNLKYILKKPLMPIAKKVRHIADAAVAETSTYAPIDYSPEINRLKIENNLLKRDLDNFESNLKYIYYYHGGSGNHGCEALVRTITSICNIKRNELGIYSYRPEQDKQFGIFYVASFIKHSVLDSDDVIYGYNKDLIALSIGGDNYCKFPNNELANYNRTFHARGVKTALIGCSIEPSVLEHGEILTDLAQFDLITARESITYNALKEKGVTKNLQYAPDSAFTLAPEPSNIKLKEHTIGINISDITNTSGEIFYKNIINLIDYILEKTTYNIALIPHVHQDFNDDLSILKRLYSHYLQNERIRLIGTSFNAPQLKDIIGQCEILVAARTHCSIAGYSMYVPTLVLGYSVKSKGIARDIFGSEENYVKNVYSLKKETEITDAFLWIEKNKIAIKKHLSSFIPKYTKKAYNIRTYLDTLRTQNTEIKIQEPLRARKNEYKKDTLSIITSCYNSENYLHRYISSILNQTNHNIELIIVNDGSTDGTEKIISNYIPLLEKAGIDISYIKQENAGIGAAYNTALKYVHGEYFCWCDSDNFYSPDFVEKVLSFLEKNRETKILRHDGYMVEENECKDPKIFEKTNFIKFSIESKNPYEKNLFMNSLLEKNWHFGNIVLSTEAFDKVNKGRKIFESRYGQNWQLCLPMLHKYEANYIPDCLFYFAIRPESESHQNWIDGDNTMIFLQLDGYKQILENIIKEMNLPNKDELFEILKQKYICKKLEIARATKNKADIAKYETIFKNEVAPNNIYQKALDQIK